MPVLTPTQLSPDQKAKRIRRCRRRRPYQSLQSSLQQCLTSERMEQDVIRLVTTPTYRSPDRIKPKGSATSNQPEPKHTTGCNARRRDRNEADPCSTVYGANTAELQPQNGRLRRNSRATPDHTADVREIQRGNRAGDPRSVKNTVKDGEITARKQGSG